VAQVQVQLSEEQLAHLRRLAAQRDVPLAEVIRKAIAALDGLAMEEAEIEKRKRALSVVGAFRSGLSDVAVEHDRYLAEIYAECKST